MYIKKMMQVLAILLPVGMDALHASQDHPNEFKLSPDSEKILENLQSIRTEMGMPPLLHYNFAFQDGLRCHTRYLSANKGNVRCGGYEEQNITKRGYQTGCVSFNRRKQNEYLATLWFRFYQLNNSVAEFFDCESESQEQAIEQILGNPYNRIQLLDPRTFNIGWSSDRYKNKSEVYGLTSRRVSKKFYVEIFGEEPIKASGGYNSNSYGGVGSTPSFTWQQKLEEYCTSSDLEEAECLNRVKGLVGKYADSVYKLEFLFAFRHLSTPPGDITSITTNPLFCALQPYYRQKLCPKLVDELKPVIKNAGGDLEDAFFELRDEFINNQNILASILNAGAPVYLYPFASQGMHKFITHLNYTQRERQILPPYVIQGLPVTALLNEMVMPDVSVHSFSLKDEHGNHIPVVTEKRANIWIFYPLRRFDRGTRYSVSMGYKEADFAEGPHQVNWSFDTKGAENPDSPLYRLGDRQWDDRNYSREVISDWTSPVTYAIDAPAEGEQVTVDVRSGVAEEIEVNQDSIKACDGWKILKSDAGSFTVQAGRDGCTIQLTGKTRALKTRMELLKENWLKQELYNDNNGLDPRTTVDQLAWISNRQRPRVSARLAELDRPELTEYRTVSIDFSGNAAANCTSSADQIFDCQATR